MKPFRVYLILLLSPWLSYGALVNAMSMHNGAVIKTKIPSLTTSPNTTAELVKWSQEALIDDNFGKGWCSQEGTRLPLQFVVELSEKYVLHKMVFGNSGEVHTGISCKNILIETSTTSALDGYTVLDNVVLTANQYSQEFPISATSCRWIRFTIQANHGHRKFTELMEIQAFGEFSKPALSTLPIEGVWDSNWDWVSVNKNPNGVYYGCYKYNKGTLFAGEVKRRVFEFQWEEKVINRKGWARLVINEEGTILRGTWGFNSDRSRFGIWEFTRKTNQPNTCWNDDEMKTKTIEPGSYQIPMEEQALAKPLQLSFDIRDKKTGIALSGTQVDLLEPGTKVRSLNPSKPNDLIKGKYSLRIHLKGYFYSEIPSFDFFQTQTLKVQLQPIVTGEKVVLQHVLFKQGKSELVDPENDELDQLARLLKENPSLRLELSGHTDNQGNPDDNKKLSEQRAAVIRSELIRRGISESRLISIGCGGSQPIADNQKEETRKLNRRVEAKVLNF